MQSHNAVVARGRRIDQFTVKNIGIIREYAFILLSNSILEEHWRRWRIISRFAFVYIRDACLVKRQNRATPLLEANYNSLFGSLVH